MSENLNDDHIFSFGHIILQWGRFEGCIDRLIRDLWCLNQFDGILLTSNMNYANKRMSLLALTESPMPPLTKSDRDKIQNILKRARHLYAIRNDVAHGLWANGKKPASIKPLSVKGRGKIKIRGLADNEPCYTAPQLMKKADALYELTEDLLKLRDSIAKKRRRTKS